MFCTRRSTLVKRLWKLRYNPDHEGNSSPQSKEDLELKSVAQSMLKRLKERHLEVLIASIESRGGELTDCVLLPKGDRELRLGKRTVAPHVLCCQLWRWPDVRKEFELKRLSCCSTADEPAYICCNPYHWSRLCDPGTPPPPYPCSETERVKMPERPSTPVSTETGMTPTAYRLYGGTLSNGASRPHWCNLAYWEHRQRVGRLYTVFEPSVSVFQELPHGDGMFLGALQTESAQDAVRRTRQKIGFGLVVTRETDGVWVYNRSYYPVFVNSPTLDIPNSRTLLVHKVLPGYSIKIFDYERSELLEQTRDPELLDGPYDPNAVRISFAKGWGPFYSRQFITSCPCWIEVLLAIDR